MEARFYNLGSMVAAAGKDGPGGFYDAVADADEAVPAVDEDVLLGAEEQELVACVEGHGVLGF